MHELKPWELKGFLEARNQKAEVDRDWQNQEKLLNGFLPFHIDAEIEYSLGSMGRSVCDVALLLIHHQDGSLDGFLSHFLPNRGYRIAHANFFDELQPADPTDQTFALLLATQNEDWLSSPESFSLVSAALKRKNGGNTPEVVMLDKNVLRRRDSDIDTDLRYFRRKEKGRMVDSIRVNNPFYTKSIIR